MSVALPGPYRSTTTRTGGRSHNRGLGSLKRSSFQPGYVVPILVGGGDIHVAAARGSPRSSTGLAACSATEFRDLPTRILKPRYSEGEPAPGSPLWTLNQTVAGLVAAAGA